MPPVVVGINVLDGAWFVTVPGGASSSCGGKQEFSGPSGHVPASATRSIFEHEPYGNMNESQ